MRFRSWLAVLAALLLAAVGRAAEAKVAVMGLDDLIRSSEGIAVAKVDRVETFEGVKLARAVVLSPLKGLRRGQTVAFVAQPTWTCDSSTAVAGETILLFLSAVDSRRGISLKGLTDEVSAAKLATSVEAAYGKDTRLYLISNSGLGRRPVVVEGGKSWASPGYFRNGERPALLPKPTEAGLVPLDSLTAYIRKATGGGKV